MSEPRRVERMDDLIAAKGFRHFQREPWVNPWTGEVDDRVLGERPDYRFLVGRDEWERTFAPLLPDDHTRLEYGGWPVEPSDLIGPDTIVFVERSASANASTEAPEGQNEPL